MCVYPTLSATAGFLRVGGSVSGCQGKGKVSSAQREKEASSEKGVGER